MKQLFVIVYFFIILANVSLCLSDTEIVDGSIIVNIDNHHIDLMGEYSELTNRMTRHCANVVKIQPGSTDWNDIASEYKSTFPESITTPRGMLKKEDWYVVEAEFSNREPQVILFRKTSGTISNIQFSGGTSAPRLAAPVIRNEFMRHEPSAPKDLVKCYDPLGPPFNK